MEQLTKSTIFDSLPPQAKLIFIESIRRLGSRPPSIIDMVAEFHTVFGHPIETKINIHNEELNSLRVELIREELEELDLALLQNDAVETFDALLDLQYVLDGAFLALGFSEHKQKGFEEVQRSNMSKLGEDGAPIFREDGKILKGPNFSEPDLSKILGVD